MKERESEEPEGRQQRNPPNSLSVFPSSTYHSHSREGFAKIAESGNAYKLRSFYLQPIGLAALIFSAHKQHLHVSASFHQHGGWVGSTS
ncbi:hypothetical protein DKX38_013733 [Salix brachista]|uniref:Uncharacterized protein n=1 Tax=Salix brachista TaxID=2182728 RepID=A0A5N5LDE1_9ROSI|nr:hypothetical protein DKX38_013733 [Salix brachista]